MDQRDKCPKKKFSTAPEVKRPTGNSPDSPDYPPGPAQRTNTHYKYTGHLLSPDTSTHTGPLLSPDTSTHTGPLLSPDTSTQDPSFHLTHPHRTPPFTSHIHTHRTLPFT